MNLLIITLSLFQQQASNKLPLTFNELPHLYFHHHPSMCDHLLSVAAESFFITPSTLIFTHPTLQSDLLTENRGK